MTRKLNILTFLIFVYSVVICLTCKRDFSQNYSKENKGKEDVILVKATTAPTSVTPRVYASTFGFAVRKINN